MITLEGLSTYWINFHRQTAFLRTSSANVSQKKIKKAIHFKNKYGFSLFLY
jgi:hypothetical protein